MPPEEVPQPTTPEPIVPPATQPSPLKQIRTYQGDIAEALKNQQESVVSIQRKEQARTARATEVAPDETPEEHSSRMKAIGMFFGIIILLIAGGAGGWFAYTQYKVKTALPVVDIAPNAFISPNETETVQGLSLNRDALIEKLSDSRRVETKTGSIKHFDIKTGTADNTALLPTETFLSLINSSAPKSLVRAFNPLFMLGTLGGQPSAHTFLIIKLDSYDNAYPGMLAWEATMKEDLLPLFATTTDIALAEPTFKDLTLQNKNVRVLRNASSTSLLLYTFFNNSVVVITDTEDTLKALLSRLSSQQLSR
ncbi:MAG: protein of unknown function with transrane region [Parcubacteria group bacterium]|nr:protein of unknown function with transrane region [Parcubacteria group bacterium]